MQSDNQESPIHSVITVELLIKDGYCKFVDPFKKHAPGYLSSYQKCMKDGNGRKMFYLNMDHWAGVKTDQYEMKESFSANAQFNTNSSDDTAQPTYNIELLTRPYYSIQFVESWFRSHWSKMQCSHYE